MRKHNEEYISMRSIKGDVRMCCSTTPEFRDKVAIAARNLGVKSQDFVLEAVRDKMQEGRRTATPEERLAMALRAFLANKRTPPHVKEGIEKMLEPFLP